MMSTLGPDAPKRFRLFVLASMVDLSRQKQSPVNEGMPDLVGNKMSLCSGLKFFRKAALLPFIDHFQGAKLTITFIISNT
jgi:hypothetical protein